MACRYLVIQYDLLHGYHPLRGQVTLLLHYLESAVILSRGTGGCWLNSWRYWEWSEIGAQGGTLRALEDLSQVSK